MAHTPPSSTNRQGTPDQSCIAVVLKGYPRLSETFIAQEIKALEDMELKLVLYSLRLPTDHTIHPIHREINAKVTYLPEYVHNEGGRVLRALWHGLRRLDFARAFGVWLRDLVRDPTPNRARRFAQALVLCREIPRDCHGIYAHFMHTPGSVARYASLLLGLPWAFSAHAKDIWTLPEWEKREKLAACAFAVTCTEANAEHLRALAGDPRRVHRVYHGIDFARFPDPGPRNATASDPHLPATILSVGRAVPKKGYTVLLKALAALPDDSRWRFVHIGGGPQLPDLERLARSLGIDRRISWLGAQPQERVLQAYREADLFVLASVVTEDGDRDGLPNVLMEAQSQRLCCIATRVSGIPELISDCDTGFLVPQGDSRTLAQVLNRLIDSPREREAVAARAIERLRRNFSNDREVGILHELLVSM